jgi:hypothetical protein
MSFGRWGARIVGLADGGCNRGKPPMPVKTWGSDDMRDALRLFEQLEIEYIPSSEARRRGPMSTCCGNIVERLIRSRSVEHATIVLRTIVESEGNQAELIADIIGAISDIVLRHPRWVDLGLQWLEAFDQINLAAIRRAAKAAGAYPLHSAVMMLICVDLERILGPSKLPKQPKPPRIKREPKPPRALTRVPGWEKNVATGMKLLALRATIKGNCAFGRAVRREFDIDAQDAAEMMKVARAYGSRPEIFTRLSWVALVTLSSPALPVAAREALESRIRAGEAIGAPEIRAARGPLRSGPRRQAGQPAARMAA